MLNFFIFLLSYLSNANLKLIDKQLNLKKYELFTKNLTMIEIENLRRDIEFIELNRLRIIIQLPLN
jgi:hypothetical protein